MVAAWLWAVADWRRGWRSILAVAVLAGVVGGVVMAGVAGARRASTAVDRMASITGWPDVLVFSGTPVPDELRTRLAADPRVDGPVEDLRVVVAGIAGRSPGLDGSIVAVPAGSRYRPLVIAGRLPAPGHPDEIAVPERVAEEAGVAPGDRVRLDGATMEALPDCLAGVPGCALSPMGDVTVTGITRAVPDLVEDTHQGLSLYADASLADAHPTIARSYLVFAYVADRADTSAVVEELSPLMPKGDVTDGRGDAGGAVRATSIERNSLLIAAALIAVAGLVVLAPTYGRHLARRRHDARLLSALGMAAPHRRLAGTLPGVAAGLLAVPVAVVVSVAGSLVLPVGAARRAELTRSLRVDGPVTVVGAVATLAGVVLVAFAVSWRWSRTPREQAPRSVGSVPRAVAALGVPPVPAAGARLALDPGGRADRVPVVPTIVATAVGVALAVGALVVAASTTGLLGASARYGAGWDLEVGLQGAPDEAEATALRLATDDRVDGAALLRSGELRVRSASGDLGEIGAVGFRRLRGDVSPTVLAGTSVGALDDVLLGSDSFERAGAHVGAEVTLEGASGSARARVVGRAILPPIGATFSDIGVILPLEQYQELGAEGLIDSLDVDVRAVLRVPESSDRAALRSELEDQGYRVSAPERPSYVTVLRGIGPVAAALSVATALVVLAATIFALVTATRRRRGELAVLRALGLRPREVRRAVSWQAVVVIAVSLAIGIPAGIIGGRVVWQAIAEANRALPVVDLPIARVIGASAVLLVVALAGSWLPARRAGETRPAEVLRSE
jgi:ABC-type lipoprotein release transport system permease subunit